MFGAIGTFVFRMRYAVIAVLVALMAVLGLFGLDLGKHLSQSGWFDPGSESVQGAVIADEALGRDHRSDVILLVTPPEGTLVDDPVFAPKVAEIVEDLIAEHPDIVNRNDPGVIDPFAAATEGAAGQGVQDLIRSRTFTDDRTRGFISIGVAGDDDTTVLNNYQTIEPFFDGLAERYDLPGTTFELAGLQPVAGAMATGMDADIRRAEIIALPLVAIMLFFVFGGVVAAFLPVFIGGLTIAGSLGIMKALAMVTELNIFAQSVVTLIGLGIAIDYGLFIVSRFREEYAEGYTTKAAVRRTVMTAGQTVVFSATVVVAALACLLIMPQGFLRSVSYGAIASVSLAALLSITVLPAALAILGPRVDALSLPGLRKMKSREEVENGFWGKFAGWVMRHPVAVAVPTVLFLLALIIPFGNIQFGGISEKFLPPDNANRAAQETFDEYFPQERTEEIKLVVVFDPNTTDESDLQPIADQANEIGGFTKAFSIKNEEGALTGAYGDYGIMQMSAGLVDRDDAADAITALREIDAGNNRIFVTGTPTLTQDSIDGLMQRLPLMAVMLVLVTGFLMFLNFGSLVLPIKAALMTALGLGSTLGILTWIFVDGHGSELANFTPGPLFAAVLVLIIAIIFGLSTDYEIFLMSRMVEARQQGASTTEAVRTGTAHTGRIITAAAAILVVVTGAFGLSEIVMMKYIAYGMIAALILDATVIRMLLVPSVMKLLGDDCWWAPRWMRVMQEKIGLGETILEVDPASMRPEAGGRHPVATATAGIGPAPAPPRPKSGQTPPRSGTPAPAAAPQTPEPPQTPAPPTPPWMGAAPVLPRRPAQTSRPDTGGWRLGDGGIRAPQSEDLRPAPSPLERRPSLDETGKRPLIASLRPEQRPAGPQAAEPKPPAPVPTPPRSPETPGRQPGRGNGESRSERRARAAGRDGEQISVQELLRRRAEESD